MDRVHGVNSSQTRAPLVTGIPDAKDWPLVEQALAADGRYVYSPAEAQSVSATVIIEAARMSSHETNARVFAHTPQPGRS